MIHKTLRGEVIAGDAMKGRDKFKKRERAFKVPTTITFDNEGSDIYTIIEVDTRDRPGLLYDLTRTLANANVYIASAVIATYGEQVVDSFYVKDMFGLKFHAVSKQKTLERKLREAIENRGRTGFGAIARQSRRSGDHAADATPNTRPGLCNNPKSPGHAARFPPLRERL